MLPLFTNKTISRKNLFLFFLLTCNAVAYAQSPSAEFTATPITGCTPLAVSFSDASTGNPTSWQWDLGNGTLSTQQHPTTTYFSPGTYSVTLTVTNANGSNTVTHSNYIVVYDKPVVYFTASDSLGCFPLRVNFTDMSSTFNGSLTSWDWDFGDGTTSTLQNPFHLYAVSGNYSVTLKVTNSGGCTKVFSKPSYIHVTPGVSVNFSNTVSQLCHPPETISFTNLATGPGNLSYQWDFGDGGSSVATSPSHIYNSGGSFNVSLIVQSDVGCNDTLIRPAAVVIKDVQVSFSGPNSVCVNQPASFINSSNPLPASSLWTFGDATGSAQQNPVKTWATAGSYLVKLVANYNTCSDSASKFVTVNALPVVNFTSNDSINCKAPFTVNFQSLSPTAVTWNWDFGDGNTSTLQNPSHTYTSSGNYTVKLVVSNGNGCQDSLVKNQYIQIARPVVLIAGVPVEGCIPYNFSPLANVAAIDGVAAYSWDFGDGGTSTLQNPTHTYPFQGSYTVKLTVTTKDGCTDSIVVPNAVTVGSLPNADFTAAPLSQCVGKAVQFTDLSVPADRWHWDFGDNGTSTVKNPSYIYSDTGMYTVALTVWNSGCSTTVVKNNFVTALPPVARFTPSYNCNNKKQVLFSDQSILPQAWAWDFGDGTTSTLQNPAHTYAVFGTYTVTLTVTNSSCSNSKIQTITLINEHADFQVADDTICKSQAAVITLQNINAGNLASTTWYYGDGTSDVTGAGQTSVSHLYNTAGLYSIKVVITDIRGCTDSAMKPNIIRVWGAAAGFSSSPVNSCKGAVINFTDLTVTDGVHPITNWLWDYGDGQTQSLNGPPFNHVYTIGGTFFPSLTVTDSYGCVNKFVTGTSLFITDPKADFSSVDTLTCKGKDVRFVNASQGINMVYAWTFGDGNSANTVNPVNVYNSDGNYNIRLVATDVNGCKDTMQKNSYIKVRTARPSFTIKDSISSCLPFEVVFTNTSVNTVSQTWDFGDGSGSTLANPSHYYFSVGTYTVKLFGTGPGGCADSAFKTITVYSNTASLTYSPLTGCSPLAVMFHASTPGPVTYLWDLNDGNTLTTTDSNLVYNYLLPGNFVPKVILKDQTGCLIPVTGIDTITVIKSMVNFGVNDSLFCDKGLVNFTDSTTSNGIINGYRWNFGDGAISTLQNPSHNYAATGLYTVRLIVTTANGCEDTLTKNNLIKVVSSPVIDITGNHPVCMPGVLALRGILLQRDTSALTWHWDFGNGKTASTQNPLPQQYDTAGTYQLELIATNSSHCTDTAMQSITIYPLPLINAGPDKTIPVGTSVTLTSSGSPVENYVWSPSIALSCINCSATVASPKNNTTYRVQVTDANGCINHDDVTVFVTCSNENVFVPNTFSPNNDGVNDIFYPRGKGLYQIQSMRIFNRWGEMVFQRSNFYANDVSAGWDGTYKGKRANIDTYTYTIEFICDNSGVLSFKGNITLIQ